MRLNRNPWEFCSDEEELRALAGHSTLEEFQSNREQRARELVEWCSIDSSKRGFEIGSGEGTVARLLADKCLSLECADISESFLARARQNCLGCGNITFHKIESDYLEFLPSERYDFGFALNVFIHFNPYDIFNYLQCVKRILKVGGLFYFDACTLGEQTINLFREQVEVYRGAPDTVRGLLNYNHPGVIRALAREAGLQVSERSQLPETGWLNVLVVKPL